MICEPCYALLPDAGPSRRLLCSTAARFGPHPRAASAPATTAPSAERGSKVHMAVDTLGHLLALHVTPASADDRAEVERLACAVQAVTDESVDVAFVDQGYTGDRAASAAGKHGIALEVVRLPEAKRGFVLLPRRWAKLAWKVPAAKLLEGQRRGSSVPSPGRPASADLSKTTNATPKRSQVSTSSRSPASC